MSFIDPPPPSPWLASLRASRRRRAEAALQRRRRRAGRTAAGALLAAMTLVAGGAVAQDGPTTSATFQAGASGSSVMALQRALGVPADGVYGTVTRRAVRRYQRNQGLAVDGIAGPATLGALGIAAKARAKAPSQPAGGRGTLAQIAACESGGNPGAISADGRYRGKYQFSRATWRDMGGSGDPAQASEATQDAIAAKLMAQRGTAPWPNCA